MITTSVLPKDIIQGHTDLNSNPFAKLFTNIDAAKTAWLIVYMLSYVNSWEPFKLSDLLLVGKYLNVDFSIKEGLDILVKARLLTPSEKTYYVVSEEFIKKVKRVK